MKNLTNSIFIYEDFNFLRYFSEINIVVLIYFKQYKNIYFGRVVEIPCHIQYSSLGRGGEGFVDKRLDLKALCR